jgi:hypothetical protein
VIPKEFARSNLALELKTGKKRLQLVLYGLTDEQCGMAGAVRSDSVTELVSHLIRNEFLALNKACERLAGSEEQLSGVEQRSRSVERRRHAGRSRSIESRLAEFEVVRSAIIRLVEQGAGNNAHYGTVAEICVARFNEHIKQIERWRGSQLVGFSATRLRAEAREAELNQAIVDLSREDFLAGNFDLKALFSLSFERFYSEDFVLLLGTEETNGRSAAFQRMAEVVEPFNTLFEMGLAFIESFHATAEVQDAEGNFIAEWETVLGGSYATRTPVRWRTVRAWKQRVVIAERIEGLGR